MPTSECSGASLLCGNAAQARIVVPVLKDGGERIHVARFVHRCRSTKVLGQSCLRRSRGQQHRDTGGQIREDFVPETQAMVENGAVFGGHTEVVALCEFDHAIGRFGIVKHERE
jgi:hypothetical protein